MKWYNTLNVLASAVIIISLLVDYFFTDEFMMEGVFVFGPILLMLVNIFRQINEKVSRNIPFSIATNILVLCFSLVGFFLLWITLFGYGFMGRTIHFVWILLALSNVCVFFLTLFEIARFVLARK